MSQPDSKTPALLPSQKIWATTGVLLVVLTFALAYDNLRSMYASADDFVVGSLLSLAGFCMGKAFTRTQEMKALELIREPTPATKHALEAEMTRRLHESRIDAQLSVLLRHIDAASDRLSEYFSAQAGLVDLGRQYSVLTVALDDLDLAKASAHALGASLKVETIVAAVPAALEGLVAARADLREAVARRDQVVRWLEESGKFNDRETRDLISTFSADVLKALRSIEMIIRRGMTDPPVDVLETIDRYLKVALLRLAALADLITSRDVELTRIFGVLEEDLTSAASRFATFTGQRQG